MVKQIYNLCICGLLNCSKFDHIIHPDEHTSCKNCMCAFDKFENELTTELLMKHVFYCYNCMKAVKIKAQVVGALTIPQIQIYCLDCKKDITYIAGEDAL